jgi:2-(1,2-epoxy-1,2-dihydrophenyl)acetyl-CoA isomerase
VNYHILEREGFVATLSFNRPDRMNSMTIESLEEFIKAVQTLNQDNRVRVLVITGVGRGFCSGADKDLIQYLIDLKDGAQFRRVLREFVHKTVNCIEQIEKPVIAAINGPAVGGGAELALACDFRIASEEARFIFTEVKIGIIPDAGAIPRLTRLLGYGKAKEIILTGRTIDGLEAEHIGLVNRCVPGDKLKVEAKQWAEQLLQSAPRALGLAKRMIDQTMDVDLMTALDMVGIAQTELWNTKDVQEGLNAFREKRKPIFTGD